MDPSCASETFDVKFLAGLLSVLVALAAYVGNVRREMIKRCSALLDDIEEKLPTHGEDFVKKIREKKRETEQGIALLVLADAPLILGATFVFVGLARCFPYGPSPFLVNAGFFLGGAAGLAMVVQHAWEWQKSYKTVRGWEWAPTVFLLIPAGIVTSLVAAWHVCDRDQYRPTEAPPQALSVSSLAADVGSLQAEISRLQANLQTRG